MSECEIEDGIRYGSWLINGPNTHGMPNYEISMTEEGPILGVGGPGVGPDYEVAGTIEDVLEFIKKLIKNNDEFEISEFDVYVYEPTEEEEEKIVDRFNEKLSIGVID